MVSKVLVATLEINLGRYEGIWVTDYTKKLLLTGRFLLDERKMLPSSTMESKQENGKAGQEHCNLLASRIMGTMYSEMC